MFEHSVNPIFGSRVTGTVTGWVAPRCLFAMPPASPLARAARPKGVQIIAEREISVDGHSGIFVHLEVGAKEVIRVQWIIAGSRLYTVSASSRKGSPEELEGKDDFEKVALGFINSFHVSEP